MSYRVNGESKTKTAQEKRMRRANGTGTLFKSRGIWYTKVKVGGKWDVKTTRTGDKEAALKILNRITQGAELDDRARLAAIKAKLEADGPRPTLEEAWSAYANAPENIGQPDGARVADGGRWRTFCRWLHGHDGGRRCRLNCKAAHPEIRTIDQLKWEVAREFVAYAKTVSSANTVNKYVRVLRRVWRLNGVNPNPWQGFGKLAAPPQLRRALDAEEVAKILREAKGELRVLFALGAFTGMRMGDCAKVRWTDFDAAGRTITVKPNKTKNSSGRVVSVPVHPSLAKIVGKRRKSGYLMPTLATWPEWKLSYWVMRHFEDCGLAEAEKPDGYGRAVAVVGFHSLRSTFITEMANVGAPMAMVQAIVGHMSPEMSMHYYRANAEAARSKVAALPGYGVE